MKLCKVFATFALCTLMLSMAACGKIFEPKVVEATKFGVVYGHYVCSSSVRLENGAIKAVSFEEAEAPYSWARVSNIATELDGEDKVTNSEYAGTSTNHAYANKIKIGGVVFTARDNGEGNNYVDYFNASKNGETPFEIWLEGSDNAKWYFEKISEGDFDVLKANGDAYNVTFKAATSGDLGKKDRWLKSKNGYWPASETRKGWQANMNAISDYIVAHGFDDYESEKDTLEPEGTEVEINGVKTGATVVFFKDYMNLANSAYKEALNKHNENTTEANLFIS